MATGGQSYDEVKRVCERLETNFADSQANPSIGRIKKKPSGTGAASKPESEFKIRPNSVKGARR